MEAVPTLVPQTDDDGPRNAQRPQRCVGIVEAVERIMLRPRGASVIPLREVCALAGVSERALHAAFVAVRGKQPGPALAVLPAHAGA